MANDAAASGLGGSPQTVQINFELAVGGGTIDASAVVPTGPVNLTQLLPVLQRLTSEIVDGVVEVAGAEGYSVSCRAGCGACCRQLVPLSLFEAEALAAWIQALPPERQSALQAKFRSALEQLEKHGMLAKISPERWPTSLLEAHQIGLEYLEARVACPFLEDESCSIHPIRPLICREYLVASPPEFCYLPSTDKVVPIPMPVKPSRALFHLGGRIERLGRGWFPLVYLCEWMKVGGRPGEAVTGTGPQLLYAFLQSLAPEPKPEETIEKPQTGNP